MTRPSVWGNPLVCFCHSPVLFVRTSNICIQPSQLWIFMGVPATAAVHESRRLHHNCYPGLLNGSGVSIYREKEELWKLEIPHFTVSCSAHTLRTQAFSTAIIPWPQTSLIHIRKEQKYHYSMNWWYNRRMQMHHIARISVLIMKPFPGLLLCVWIFFLSFHSTLHVSCFISPWQKASWKSISALQWKAAALKSYHVKNKQQALRLNHLKTEGTSISWYKNAWIFFTFMYCFHVFPPWSTILLLW